MSNEVDILENEIRNKYPEVLEILLRDHTTQKNIFWATDIITGSLGADTNTILRFCPN